MFGNLDFRRAFNGRRWAGLRSWVERRSARRGLGSGFVPPAPVLSGTYVTPQTALSLTAVFGCINRISGDIATLPVELWERTSDGGFRLDGTDYYQELLGVETDDETGAFKFHLDSQGHTLGYGNSFSEIVRGTRGRAEEIHLLHPAKTAIKRDGRGLYYQLDNDKELLAENCLHFAGLGFNGVEGYSPLTVARQTIGIGLATEQYGAAFYGNGANPSGILKTKKELSEPAQNNLRRSINEVHQGPQNSHQFMILEEDMDWIQTQISPADAQFLLGRQFTVIEIARLYGVPPHKIGDYSQAHLSNVEESNLDYIATTLAFWITMREKAFNRRLLTKTDRQKYVIRYDMSWLLRGNSQARIGYYQGMRNMGCMSADDIRRKEGMNPLGPKMGGDKYLVQAQYSTLDRAGDAINAKAAPPNGTPPPTPPGTPQKPGMKTPPPKPAADQLERRTFVGDVELRAAPEGSSSPGTLVGYAAVFEKLSVDLGYFREKIKPGAFTDVLSNDVRGLFNHDENHVLGRTAAGTLRLFQDEIGLRFELDLPNTSTGRDLAESIGRRDITGCSFTFLADIDTWDLSGQVAIRTVEHFSLLLDVGPVTFPAYDDTSVSSRPYNPAKASH